MKKLANRIRTIRLLRNLSQENMAEELKMSQQNYSKLESGNRDIKITILAAIADILGVKVEDILAFDDKIISKIRSETSKSNRLVSSQNEIEEENKKSITKELNELKDRIRHLESKI